MRSSRLYVALIASAALAISALAGCGASARAAGDAPRAAPGGREPHDGDDPPSGALPPGHAPLTDGATGAIPFAVIQGKPRPGAEKSFPKATTEDKDCTADVGLVGLASKDYDALVAKCGAPTGLKEYVKRVAGRFEPGHVRETYAITMVAGLCYRFFLVADASIAHLDVRVQRPSGAMLSLAHATEPVVILNPDRTWCKHHEREYHIVVETDHDARGQYVFGVWARPDPKR